MRGQDITEIARGPDDTSVRVGYLGGEPMPLSGPILQIAGLPTPFLLSPEFAHHDSHPTAHEWLDVKRVERGAVCPFHASEVRDA